MDRFTAILARRCAAYEPTRLVMRPRAGLRRAAVLCPIVDVGAGEPVCVETTERRTWRIGEPIHLALAPDAMVRVGD